MAHAKISARKFFRWLPLVLMLGLGVSGCARWNWRGDGFRDPDVNDAAKLRPATGGQKTGMDSRAREIESDLGIR
jgi:hypothetical protein